MQKRQISENVAGTLPRTGRASGVEKCRCQQERLFQLYPPNELTSAVRPVVGAVCGIWLAAVYNPQMDPGAVRRGLQCGRAGSDRRPEDFPGPLFGSRQRLDNGYRRPAGQVEPDSEVQPKPEFVIVDHEISPNQARNLERATGAQVLDRTGVIVEIFHRHAHSREAKLQVEMARLKCMAFNHSAARGF